MLSHHRSKITFGDTAVHKIVATRTNVDSFAVQANSNNGGRIFIQAGNDDGTAPGSITEDTYDYELIAGQIIVIGNSPRDSLNGEFYDIAQWYWASETGAGKATATWSQPKFP